jgi:hypothetical protein
VIDAINAGQIPPAFQEDLQSRANELVNTVNCPPPPTTAPSDDEELEKKKKGKKKKDDDVATTSEEELEPAPTVTEGDG